MVLEVVEIPELCGPRASIYTVLEEGSIETFFEKFIVENDGDYPEEIENILSRLETMAFKTGVRDQYLNFGKGNYKANENVCDIRVAPKRKLRLYCIKMNSCVLIVGGGGPKDVQKIQDDEKLTEENFMLRHISSEIFERIKPPFREIEYSTDGLKLIGNLTFHYE